MYWGIKMSYPYTNPIREIPPYSQVPKMKEIKACAVCSAEFPKRKNADTFELRQLCHECIKAWQQRDRLKAGYRKDV